MTAETARRPAEPTLRDLLGSLGPADRFRIAVGSIVIAQAVWLGALMSRGWYFEADFSNLGEAAGHGLTWSYLAKSQGGHFGIPGRAVFWVLSRTIPLNFPATIALRLLAQAAATVLLARLLTVLVGRRRGVLIVLTLYAFSPLLVQSTLWLTSSIGFLGSQLFVLLTLHVHIRYVLTRQLRWAAATAGALFSATLLSEQSAVIAVILPLLSVAFLHDGTPRQRLRALLSCWPEWVIISTPVAAFVAYFFGSGKYLTGDVGLGVASALRLIGKEWTASIAPAIAGGPFRWFSTTGNYFAVADPTLMVRVLAVMIVSIAVVVSVHRTGKRALVAWAMPAVVSAIGILVVAVGRYDAFGSIIALRFEYAAYTAAPLAVAACLAFWPTTPDEIRGRLTGLAPASARQEVHRGDRVRSHLAGWLVVLAASCVVVASLVSAATYTRRWSQAPSRRYVETLVSSAKAAGPGVDLFDTFVSASVIPGIEPVRHISDLLALTGVRAHFDGGGATPRIVGPDGRIVPAVFLPSASVIAPNHNAFCSNIVHGVLQRDESLNSHPRRNEWFVKLVYFQQHASVVYVSVIDADGTETVPVSGSRTVLASNLGSAYLRFAAVSPVSLRIRSTSTSTNVCLTAAQVGYPFPASR